MIPWTRSLARTPTRAYSCTSSSSPAASSKVSPAHAAQGSSSKLRLAMNARKALGAKGVDGCSSGRLAIRRASMWASMQRKGAAKATQQHQQEPAVSTPTYTSSAAAYIANPSAFRPVHLYLPQYALHSSFTPPHMPLPVHLGIQTYLKPDPTPHMADDLFTSVQAKQRDRAVENLVKVSTHDAPRHKKGITALREHLATVANLSTAPQLAASLPAGTWPSGSDMEHDDEGLLHPHATFGPSSEFGRGATFDEMVRRRLTGAKDMHAHVLSPMQQADNAWETVLQKMHAVQATTTTSTTTTTTRGESSETDITTAVTAVESLLSRLGLGSHGGKSSSFRRGTSTRRLGRLSTRGAKGARMSAIGRDVAWEEMVWMDSVKRKRQKKISKHKYKKRRKATRAERKKLGK
ncbi:hypothetical protein NliqN6_6801 [Naganishia liquefaciens]|uniref:Ribosomal protein mS38 C-terminal domain-containing protein n=1 Tax=Naganishia liquefaciens TaxID=104408 RepID=A0A8H3YHY2_9TREE|nr:hypothetical protein NliqN6_6801 [Naganishia liquefaciens]